MLCTFVDFWHALGLTESQRDTRAWGDDGLAVGEFQMHPAFYHDWQGDVRPGDSWDTAFRKALRRFYDAAQDRGSNAVEAAAGYHLHGRPWGDPQDCQDYCNRFTAALRHVRTVLAGKLQ